jgi:carbonic anhydrase
MFSQENIGYEWNYSRLGPDYWPHLDPSCAGVRQSPINIDSSQAIYKHIKPIEFFNYGSSSNWTIEQTKTGGFCAFSLFINII